MSIVLLGCAGQSKVGIKTVSKKDCLLEVVNISEAQMTCLKSHPVVQAIPKNILDYRATMIECHDCHIPLANAGYYFNKFKSPYLAIGMEENRFGGYNVYVVFQKDFSLHRLWLYEIDKNIYQLRSIEQKEPNLYALNKIKKLAKSKRYWQRLDRISGSTN